MRFLPADRIPVAPPMGVAATEFAPVSLLAISPQIDPTTLPAAAAVATEAKGVSI